MTRKHWMHASPINASKRERMVALYMAGLSFREVANRVDLSKTFVRIVVAAAGIPSRSSVKISATKEREIVDAYRAGKTTTYLGRRYHVYQSTICYILERNGVQRRDCSTARRRYRLNETVFDSLTSEARYWIGFLMADGNVSSKQVKMSRNNITISLSVKDRRHIHKFRRFMGTNKKPRILPPRLTYIGENAVRSGPMLSLTIHSKKLVSTLKGFGIVPRKTNICVVTPGLEMDRDFWRGAIDGDGWVSVRYPSTHPWGILNVGFCGGSKQFVKQARAYFSSVLGKHLKISWASSAWRVVVVCQDAAKLARALYENWFVFTVTLSYEMSAQRGLG